MIYLDNGATSFPKPKGMVEAMNRCIRTYCGNPGRSGHYMSMKTAEEVYKARRSVAKVFGIENPERVVFANNATGALNLGIKGVLKEGDHVITTAMEHNSVLRPLKALEGQGISHTIVKCQKDGSVKISDIEAAIKGNTRLIVCTHASNVVGTIMPIEEIGRLARQKGILFLVDCAQSAGSVPIDVGSMNIDLLAFPGHKGLLGPLGTGALYAGDHVELEHLLEGGTGTESKDRNQPREFPEGYESGTVNAPGIIGLGYSAEYVLARGVDSIGRYEAELLAPLDGAFRNMKGITVYGPSDCKKKTGIVTINIDGRSCEEAGQLLSEDYGIAVRGGFHCAGLAHKTMGTWECGAVRFSVGPFTTMREIKAAIEAVHRISRRR